MLIHYGDVRKIDLSRLNKVFPRKHRKLLLGEAGKEHYKLLAYLSKNITGLIIELGTHIGTSSMALSENSSNVIITYDLTDIYKVKKQPKNVIRKIGDIFSLGEEKMLLKAELIFLDAAHTGKFEWDVFSFLKKNNYKGLLLLDDIHWSDEMIECWNKIDSTKYDITDIGHGDGSGPKGNISGTGLVTFAEKIELVKN
jgi:hypothetical protein